MDMQLPNIVICGICREFLDTNNPHAMVNHDYAHLSCADEYDARDRGSPDLNNMYNAVTRITGERS